MPNSANNAVNNLLLGVGAAQQARAEADVARQRAVDAERRAMTAEMDASRVSTDADLERGMKEAMFSRNVALGQLETMRKALEERDAIITEWMHSNEAFKRLARQYGKKLGVTDDVRKTDFANAVVDIAEEDPAYAGTELAEAKRKQLGKS